MLEVKFVGLTERLKESHSHRKQPPYTMLPFDMLHSGDFCDILTLPGGTLPHFQTCVINITGLGLLARQPTGPLGPQIGYLVPFLVWLLK
jgi:hypothetical protein